jgi:hypothetical protein
MNTFLKHLPALIVLAIIAGTIGALAAIGTITGTQALTFLGYGVVVAGTLMGVRIGATAASTTTPVTPPAAASTAGSGGGSGGTASVTVLPPTPPPQAAQQG